MEVSTNSAEPPETERDCRKDERHKDGSIDQHYGTSYITNNEFVTQMEVSANSAEFPEVKMDFKFILWTLKIHAYLSQHNEVSTTQNEASNYNKPYYSFAILHVNVRWKGWVKTLPFSFCTYSFGERDPRVPGEKGRLIGIEPVKEYVQIGESQFLIEPGNLSESWGLSNIFSNGIQQQQIQLYSNSISAKWTVKDKLTACTSRKDCMHCFL